MFGFFDFTPRINNRIEEPVADPVEANQQEANPLEQIQVPIDVHQPHLINRKLIRSSKYKLQSMFINRLSIHLVFHKTV